MFFHSFTFAGSLLRMRQELAKVIAKHALTKGDISAQTLAQSAMYGAVLQGLTVRI